MANLEADNFSPKDKKKPPYFYGSFRGGIQP